MNHWMLLSDYVPTSSYYTSHNSTQAISSTHSCSSSIQRSSQQYDYIRTLRQNLEKARNLSYMISKREKMKKALVETFEETSLSIGILLLNGTVPISQRRTDKLLELWELATRGGTLPDDEASQEEELDGREGCQSTKPNQWLMLPMCPLQEEDSVSNSGISTLTEYSLAVSNSDSSTLYEYDFENAASMEEAPKKKKNQKCCCRSHAPDRRQGDDPC
uniref:Uncharacterized protein n=1 Tax=Ditylenchus dipsaci TaxID=166011 RepID=A0A915D3Z9_9BILA